MHAHARARTLVGKLFSQLRSVSEQPQRPTEDNSDDEDTEPRFQ